MSVTIRLTKIGKKNSPSFRVVVTNTRSKRNGKFLDTLGFYNPSNKGPSQFSIDKNKYEDWKKKGALTTEAVEKLITGKYEFKPYHPKEEEKTAKTAEKQNQPPSLK